MLYVRQGIEIAIAIDTHREHRWQRAWQFNYTAREYARRDNNNNNKKNIDANPNWIAATFVLWSLRMASVAAGRAGRTNELADGNLRRVAHWSIV